MSIFNPLLLLFYLLLLGPLVSGLFPACPGLNIYSFLFFALCCSASIAVSGRQLQRTTPDDASHRTTDDGPPTDALFDTELFSKGSSRGSGSGSDDAAGISVLHRIARMTRIWSRSERPAFAVRAGPDGSIASRPRAPAVSEPCRRRQPDMAHQTRTRSGPTRRITDRASASSDTRRPASTPTIARQAGRHRPARTQAVDPRDISATGAPVMQPAPGARACRMS